MFVIDKELCVVVLKENSLFITRYDYSKRIDKKIMVRLSMNVVLLKTTILLNW